MTTANRFDRSATVVLTAAIAVLVAILVRREWSGPSDDEDRSPQRPVFTGGWRAILTAGRTVGDTAAPLQFIEFVDLQCVSCRKQQLAIQRLRDDLGKAVALTLVPLPLDVHPFSVAAARAAECVAATGDVERFITAAFRKQDSLGRRPWDAYRRDAGLGDSARFNACITDTVGQGRIDAGRAMARTFAVNGTPTLFLNGWRYDGAVPYRDLHDAAARILAGDPPPGAEPSRVLTTSTGAPAIEYDSTDLANARQLTLTPVPLGVSDAASADFDLTRASDVKFLSDGRIIVQSLQPSRLLLLDQRARGIQQIGRPGSGPGEFRSMGQIGVVADTIVVADVLNDRASWILPTGALVRSRRLRADVPIEVREVDGVLPNGGVVVSDGITSPTNFRHTDTSVVGMSRIGVLRPTGFFPVATIPSATFIVVDTKYRGRPGRAIGLPYFSGGLITAVWDSSIVTARGDRDRVDLRDTTGRITGSIVLHRARRPVTAAMRRAMVRIAMERLASPSGEHLVDSAESTRLIAANPFADSLPGFQTLQVSPEGVLWIVDAIAPGDTAWTATAFHRDGTIAGRLRGEGSAIPMAFGRDRVVVRAVDDNGVVTLRVHQIIAR